MAGDKGRMELESRLDDPLHLIEHLLRVMRADVERDEAFERLIHELEDQRAALIAIRLRGRSRAEAPPDLAPRASTVP
jgi:hypothetical protein